MSAGRKTTPAATPALPSIPDDLIGWYWVAHPTTGEHALQAPGKAYTTKFFSTLDERPAAEARRWLKSQPKPTAPATAPLGGELPPPLQAEIAEQVAALGLITEWVGRGEDGSGWLVYWPGEDISDLVPQDDADIREWLRSEVLWQAPPIRSLADWRWEREGDEVRLVSPAGAVTSWVTRCASAAFEATSLTLLTDAGTPAPVPVTKDDSQIVLRGGTPDAAGVYQRPPGVPEFLDEAAIDQVVPGRFQDRTDFDPEQLQELAQSIKADGLINRPIVFVNETGQYELLAGERRWRAAQLAGLTSIPLRVVEGDARRLDVIALVDNVQRQDLSPVEEGKAFERLMQQHSLSENELHRLTGKSRSYIQQRRALAGAAPGLTKALRDGAVSFTLARAIAAGAPGNVAAQEQALSDLKGRSRWDGPATEADAKGYAEKAVLATAGKTLASLGWSVERFYHDVKEATVVYTPVERPTIWTSADVLRAIDTQRRPGSGQAVPPAEPALDRAAKDTLMRRGYGIHWAGPWAALVLDGKWTFAHAGEVAPIVTAAQLAIEAMEARFTAKGWRVEWGGRGSLTAKKRGGGGYEHAFDWKGIAALATKIERGTIASSGAMRACGACKQPSDDLEYRGSVYACPACRAQIAVAEQQERDQIRAALADAQPVLAQLPAPTLRLLLALGRGALPALGLDRHMHTSDATKRVAAHTADVDDLAALLLDRLAEGGRELGRDGLLALGVGAGEASDMRRATLIQEIGAIVVWLEGFAELDVPEPTPAQLEERLHTLEALATEARALGAQDLLSQIEGLVEEIEAFIEETKEAAA
jgi:ParB/RepB/Spo0J family partition protein